MAGAFKISKVETIQFDWNTLKVIAGSNGVAYYWPQFISPRVFNDNPQTIIIVDFLRKRMMTFLIYLKLE